MQFILVHLHLFTPSSSPPPQNPYMPLKNTHTHVQTDSHSSIFILPFKWKPIAFHSHSYGVWWSLYSNSTNHRLSNTKKRQLLQIEVCFLEGFQEIYHRPSSSTPLHNDSTATFPYSQFSNDVFWTNRTRRTFDYLQPMKLPTYRRQSTYFITLVFDSSMTADKDTTVNKDIEMTTITSSPKPTVTPVVTLPSSMWSPRSPRATATKTMPTSSHGWRMTHLPFTHP